jgi:hypothetical protein
MMTPFKYCAENGSTKTFPLALSNHEIVFGGLIFDEKAVLEAAAAARLDAHAESALRRIDVLGFHELL